MKFKLFLFSALLYNMANASAPAQAAAAAVASDKTLLEAQRDALTEALKNASDYKSIDCALIDFLHKSYISDSHDKVVVISREILTEDVLPSIFHNVLDRSEKIKKAEAQHKDKMKMLNLQMVQLANRLASLQDTTPTQTPASARIIAESTAHSNEIGRLIAQNRQLEHELNQLKTKISEKDDGDE